MLLISVWKILLITFPFSSYSFFFRFFYEVLFLDLSLVLYVYFVKLLKKTKTNQLNENPLVSHPNMVAQVLGCGFPCDMQLK